MNQGQTKEMTRAERSLSVLIMVILFGLIITSFRNDSDHDEYKVKIDQVAAQNDALESKVDQANDSLIAIQAQQAASEPHMYPDPMMPPDDSYPTYTACDSLNEELTYLNSLNVPEGLVVVGENCATVDMTGGNWPTWGYQGSPEDVWEYQIPEDVVYDVFGNSDNPLSAEEVPYSQHPFYPDALTIQDMVPDTLVCLMTGDVAQGSFVVTGIGAYLSNSYMMYGMETAPFLYWTDGNGQPLDLTLNGVIPSEDGYWSASWLKAGTCNF